MYIYMGLSVQWVLGVLCVCVFVCVCVCVYVCVCVSFSVSVSVFVCLRMCVWLRPSQSVSKKTNYASDLSKLIVCIPPSFCMGMGRMVEPLTKFSKREGLTGSQFLEGGCWESGSEFFRGFVVLTKKTKIWNI